MGHIDILVVGYLRVGGWKVKTLLAGLSPTSPMKRRLPTPLFPTLPFGNRSLHGPKFGPSSFPFWSFQAPLFEAFELPFLKLPSSPGSYTEQYHMELIRLPRHLTRWPRLPSSRDLIQRPVHGFQVGYAFIYRLPSPEAIHGLHLNSSSATSIWWFWRRWFCPC